MVLRNWRTGVRMGIDAKVRRLRYARRRISRWWRCMPGDRFGGVAYMVTLTYRPDCEWSARDITEFIQWFRRRDYVRAYAWVAEVQKRGAVHYHVVMVGRYPTYSEVVEAWGGRGRTHLQLAYSVGYLLKYLGKGASGELPKGVRKFGVWFDWERLDGVALWFFRLSGLPPWVEEVCYGWGSGLATREGGVWITSDGLVLESDWVVDF